ncbi:MAG: glycosyltransferase family 39 protein [Acidobacteria bacterium]|nr:glycosyltransferase family 39 protein [Acidobacteriota bacterium]
MGFVKERLFWPAVILIAALGTFLVYDHSRLDSATMDEPFHALAAAEYAISGTYWANLEHPPLMKLLAGVSMEKAGARAPRLPEPFSFKTAEMPRAFSYENSIPPEALFAAARRPFPFLLFLLVAAGAVVVRHFAGPLAGVAAALFLAFEPNLVAHAGVLHTDAAATLGYFVTITLALFALKRRSWLLWAATGISMGLSLAAKFSAVLLAPLTLALVLLFILKERRDARDEPDLPPSKPLRHLGGLILAGTVAGIVLLATYHVCMRNMDAEKAARAAELFLKSRGTPAAETETVVRISRLLPEAGHYLAGLKGIAVQNRLGGNVNYLRGETSVDGFWDYFFVAFAVKSSAAFLVLLVSALLLSLIRRTNPAFFEVGLLFPAAFLYLSGIGASYNIGIRHMLPATPLLLVSAVILIWRNLTREKAAALCFALGALQAVETFASHPHEFSFFNVLSGGPGRGEYWLNDSNLDWGQDLLRLRPELTRLGIREEEVTIAYFGGGLVPSAFPKSQDFAPEIAREIPPGIYAVSSFIERVAPEFMVFNQKFEAARGYALLRAVIRQRGEAVGRVGYSIRIYRIPR